MSVLNLRLAGICIAVIVALTGGVSVLHGLQNYWHASSLLQAAEKERADKQFHPAIDHFALYLKYNPTDKKALLEFGMCLAEAHSYNAAYPRLEEVLRTGAEGGLSADENRTARRKLVDVYMAIGRWPDAESHLKALLGVRGKGKEFPEELAALKDADPELLNLLAQCEVAMGKDEDGVAAFKEAIHRAPNQVESYARLLLPLRYRLKREKEADAICDLMLKNNPKSIAALQDAAHYMRETARIPKALEYANRILAISPEDPKGLWIAAYCHLTLIKNEPNEAGQLAEWNRALELINKGVKFAPTDLGMYLLKLDVLLRRSRLKEAMDCLKEAKVALKNTPGYGHVVFNMALLQIDDGKYAEVQKAIQELTELKFRPQLVEYLRARVEFSQKDWLNARVRLEKILPELAYMPLQAKQANSMIAICYGIEFNTEKQLAAYRRAVAIDPYFFPARNGIADILLHRNDIDGALKEYQQACKVDSTDLQARIGYARMLIRKTALLPKNEQNWRQVDQAIAVVGEKAPGSLIQGRLVVDKLMVQERFAEAETLIVDLRAKAPDNIELYTLPIFLAIRQKDWLRTERCIAEAKEKFGDVYGIRAARIRYIVSLYPDEKCKPLVEKLGEDVTNLNATETAQLWGLMVNVALSLDDIPWARALCQKIAALDPTDVRTRYLLIELALRGRDDPKAAAKLDELDRTLDELKKITGPGYMWCYGMAVRKSLEKKNDPALLHEALSYVNQARELMPNWWPAAAMAASIKEKLGNNDAALEDYLAAIEHGGKQVDVVRRAVQLLMARHQYEEAGRIMKDLKLDDDRLTPELRQQQVIIETYTGSDLDDAFRKAKKSVAANSTNYRDCLWQGQMIGVLAHRAKTMNPERFKEFCDLAEGAYFKAVELSPKSEECYVVAVQFLADFGRLDAAQRITAVGEQNLTGPKGLMVLGICYQALGKYDEAQRRFEAAVKAAPENTGVLRQAGMYYVRRDDFTKAEPILRQIIKLQSKDTMADVNWARRSLAEAILRRGGFQNLCAAFDLVEENLHTAIASSEDRRMKARLLLADPRHARHKEAIALFNEMIDRNEARPDDRFQLASLYLKTGSWKEYRDQMQKILGLNDDPQQTLHRAAFIQVLIDHKETDDAERLLQDMEKKSPNHIETVSLRAALDISRKQYETASSNCMAFIDNMDAEPSNRLQRIFVVAALMEGFAKKLQNESNPAAAALFLGQADLLYKSYGSQHDAQQLVVVGYLARQGKTHDALELLTQVWDKLSIAEQCAAVEGTAHNGVPVAEQLAALEALVDKSLNQHNRPCKLLLAKAELCTLQYASQKKIDMAEAVYREALAKEPKNYTALNNLTILLARRGQHLDEALGMAKQTLQLAGPMSAVLDTLAVVYIARNQPDEALAELRKAVADDPKPNFYFHMARAYYMQHNLPAAKDALENAKQAGFKPETLDPSEKACYETMHVDL